MSGSELATIWMSRIAMNMPTHMATKPNHVTADTCGSGAAFSFIRESRKQIL